MKLSIITIIDYVGGEKKRPVIEGEALLDAGHIIMCGVKDEGKGFAKIEALCLQTSDLNGRPHKIDVLLKEEKETVHISGSCSCKAGASSKCKHFVGTLLHVNRITIEGLERLSCTDLTQKWGKMKRKDFLAPIPIEEYCHCSKKRIKKIDIPSELQEVIRKNFVEGAPQSEFAKHYFGRNDIAQENNDPVVRVDYVSDLMMRSLVVSILNSDHIELNNRVMLLHPDLQKYYNENISINFEEAAEICMQTQNQTGGQWLEERRKRITGSRCYELYTYTNNKKPNWNSKLDKIIFPKNVLTKGMVEGILNEEPAIKCYEKETTFKVEKTGLIVLPQLPWAGFSPDGIVWEKRILIEVKTRSLDEGKEDEETLNMSALDLIKNGFVPYIEQLQNGNFVLKKKHKYYGQVQWGLAILNFEICDFIVYAPRTGTYHPIKVPYDEEFANLLFSRLEDLYFTRMLPFLFQNTSR